MRNILIKLVLLIFLGLGTAYALLHISQTIDDIELPDLAVPMGDPTPTPVSPDHTTRTAVEEFLKPMDSDSQSFVSPRPPSPL